MKRDFTRAAVAAAAIAFTGIAQAVPIFFDFTGTVTGVPASQLPLLGQAASGGFMFETDRLFATPFGANPLSQNFVDFGNPSPNSSVPHLAIGGNSIAFPMNEFQYSSIGFNDACSPAPPQCTPTWAEDFVLFAFTSDMPLDTTGVTGSFYSRSLFFFSAVPMLPPEPGAVSGRPAFDYFDLLSGNITPFSIVDLPLYDLGATYSESLTTCTNGECVSNSFDSVNFNVTSVTRSVGSASVPEPGTLALFGVALLGFFSMRRKRGTVPLI